MKNVFFVRTNSSQKEAEDVFGKIEYVDAGVEGEIGFITGEMTEADFAAKSARLTILSAIRVGN